MLFSNTHFVNLLGDLLTKRASSAKLEKFFANQVREKLKQLENDQSIESSLSNI